MKQSKVIRAYKSITTLYEQKLPLTISHKLWMLRQKLTPTWEFQNEKEQEVIRKYNPTIGEDGSVSFKDNDEAIKFRDEYLKTCNELADLDVDIDNDKKIVLKLDDKLELSVEDIEALSEFVDFEE